MSVGSFYKLGTARKRSVSQSPQKYYKHFCSLMWNNALVDHKDLLLVLV